MEYNVKLEVLAGSEISVIIENAISLSRRIEKEISFDFNDIEIHVDQYSDIKKTINLYYNLLKPIKKVISVEETK
jgi:hypothetical protein